MIRNCFLCNGKTEVLFSSSWPLPGVGLADIGFSICHACGSVCQSPTIPFEKMLDYYNCLAVYTNPGRQFKPSIAKVRDVDEQVQFIRRGIGELPKSALQIGSSDGYTLHGFKTSGVERVLGIEPGVASVEIAKNLYGIECINSSAEAFEIDEDFELIILTHVLEHLYDPQMVLEKCRSLHGNNNRGYIYIEVPLLADHNSLPPGFFSFEHINYYTRENLTESICMAGYSPVSFIEHYESNLSPIIGILATTEQKSHVSIKREPYEIIKKNILEYHKDETAYWKNCLKNIENDLLGANRIFLWGAGIHTCQLVANTHILEKFNIAGLTDTSELKWGIQQGNWLCQSPDSIDWSPDDVVIISSYASEKEIYDALQWLRDIGVKTLRLHNIDDPKAH